MRENGDKLGRRLMSRSLLSRALCYLFLFSIAPSYLTRSRYFAVSRIRTRFSSLRYAIASVQKFERGMRVDFTRSELSVRKFGIGDLRRVRRFV